MFLHRATDVLPEAAGVKVVVADRLDEGVCVDNVEEADRALARRLVVLGEKLPAHVDQLENDERAEESFLRSFLSNVV